MEGRILGWDRWMRAVGDFYDYHDVDGFGRMYEVHRRSIMPAMRVCREWSSLLLNERTQVVCEDRGATDWLGTSSPRQASGGALKKPSCARSGWALGSSASFSTWT